MCVFGGWRAVKPDMELAFPKHSSRGRTTNLSPLGKSRKFQLDKEFFREASLGPQPQGRDGSWDGEVGDSAHCGDSLRMWGEWTGTMTR